MSGWRAARPEELVRIWPAARAARVVSSAEELQRVYRKTPWCVRVSDRGDALVLRPWRAHLKALAIKAALAPEHRLTELVGEARAVGWAQGFESIVSPLVPASRLRPYVAAGMDEVRAIVALQGSPGSVAATLAPSVDLTVRSALPTDIPALVALDADCFEVFWRYGAAEFVEVLARERVMVAERNGVVVAYAASSLAGSSCTIGRLGVATGVRRSGLGQSLLRDVALWADEVGAFALSLCTQEHNAASRALYRRAGLVEVEEPYAIATGASGGDTHVRT